jgi:flagellar biosynthesis protein FlhG
MVVPIVSLKGGVGKSTISLNLSDVLADYFKTLVIDTDQQNTISSLLCKKLKKGFSEVIVGEAEVEEVIQKAFDDGNLYFIPTGKYAIEHPIEFEEAITREKLAKIFKILEKEFKFIVIDTPPRISKHVKLLLEMSDFFIVVISPDPASVASLSIFLDYLKKENLDGKFSIVVNNLEPNEINEDIYTFIQAISKNNIFGTLPKDVSVLESEASCLTVRRYDKSSAFATYIEDIAKEVVKRTKNEYSFFNKL